MTDTEREALCKRIDELCQENERLRAANAAFTGRSIRAGDKMACLEAENAKLRELLHITGTYCVNGYCEPDDGCPLLVDRKCQLTDRMRELGVDE